MLSNMLLPASHNPPIVLPVMNKRRPRIVWILPSLEIGGTERQAALLLPRLVECFQPGVITLYREGTLAESLRHAGVEVISLQGRSLYDLTLGYRLKYLIRQWQPAVVQSFFWDANVWTAWALGRKPSPVYLCSRREIGSWRKRRHIALERWSARRSWKVVVNSHAALEYACKTEGLEPERLILIPNAIDAERFQRIPRVETRQRLNLSEDLLVLGVVASLAEKKGHADLLAALREAKNQLPPFQLLILGEGRLRNCLEQMAGEFQLNESVQFLGERLDVEAILPALDLLVHPSHTESFPNAVLEGMAAGLPVIATQTGGTGELIESNVNGILIAPASPGSLAQAIITLAHSPQVRRQLGNRARKYVEEYHALAVITQKYERLYFQGMEAQG